MLSKIISGGQTGADQAALDAAIELGIPHGGWIPKGRLTEAGSLPDKYNLTEMPTKDYLERTRQNVLDSDGTVIFSHGDLKGGSKRTADFATELRKPFLHIDLTKTLPSESAEVLAAWVKAHDIDVLNVAGSRASKDSSIYLEVRVVLELAVEFMKEQALWECAPEGVLCTDIGHAAYCPRSGSPCRLLRLDRPSRPRSRWRHDHRHPQRRARQGPPLRHRHAREGAILRAERQAVYVLPGYGQNRGGGGDRR